jgi:hypothetical protein
MSLLETHPHLIKEWHPTKNAYTLAQVTSGSHKRIWWVCSINHEHIYESEACAKAQGRGCPVCAGKVVTAKNNLLAVNPTLSSEWDTNKNGLLSPDKVLPFNNTKVWWKCEHEHSWKAQISGNDPFRI